MVVCRGETDYVNPYLEEKDDGDILARLRRDTKNDRKNKKNYKRQVLRYLIKHVFKIFP